MISVRINIGWGTLDPLADYLNPPHCGVPWQTLYPMLGGLVWEANPELRTQMYAAKRLL